MTSVRPPTLKETCSDGVADSITVASSCPIPLKVIIEAVLKELRLGNTSPVTYGMRLASSVLELADRWESEGDGERAAELRRLVKGEES